METWPMTQQNSLTNIRHDGKCSWLLSLLLLFFILLFRLRCYERQTCFSAYGDVGVGLTLLYQEGNVEHVLDACAKTVRIQNKFEIVHRLFPRLLELGENMGHHLLQWTSHLQFILSYYTVRGRHIATNQPATITRLRFLGWRSLWGRVPSPVLFIDLEVMFRVLKFGLSLASTSVSHI